MSVNGELIESLPTDDSPYNQQIANVLFKNENVSIINNVTNELKEAIIICILFIIFSSVYVDDVIKKLLPSAHTNFVLLMGVKCVFIIILFYFFKNFHFARK